MMMRSVTCVVCSQEAYKETQTVHLPSLLLDIIKSLTSHIDRLNDTELVSSLRLMSKLLSYIQPALTIAKSGSTPRRSKPNQTSRSHVANCNAVESSDNGERTANAMYVLNCCCFKRLVRRCCWSVSLNVCGGSGPTFRCSRLLLL